MLPDYLSSKTNVFNSFDMSDYFKLVLYREILKFWSIQTICCKCMCHASLITQIFVKNTYVPEDLNIHVNENNKKIYVFRRIFFSSSEKLTFEKQNVFFLFLF